jgi:hypothetical protein
VRLVAIPLLILAFGCTEPVDAALLHVEGVDADRLEPGAVVRVSGRGFPTGRTGRVRLSGLAHRPGEAPTFVEAETEARAETTTRLLFTTDEAILSRLGGHGTLVGMLRVEFPGEDGAVVSGELEALTLIVRPGGLGELSGMLRRERRGEELLAHLGITPRDDVSEAGGVVVESFPPDSIADRGGVQKGDRIVALGPMRVDDVGDLVPPPRARSIELVLERPGLSHPVHAPVTLEPTATGPTARSSWGASLAVALAFILLFLVSPVARLTTRFWRALRGGGRELVPTLLGVAPLGSDKTLLRRVARFAWLFIAFVALVVAFGVLPLTVRVLPGTIDAAVLATATIGLAIAVAVASRRGVPLTARLASVAWTAVAALPAIVAVAAVALPVGSFRLEAVSAAQGGEPWAWAGFSSLPAFMGLVAGFVSLVVVPSNIAPSTTAQVLERVRLFVGASLFTVVFLGGFSLPFHDADPLLAGPVPRISAALFFVLKTLTVVVVGFRLSRSAPSARLLAATSALSALLAAASAAFFMMTPTSAPPSAIVGPVAFAAVCIVLVVGFFASKHDAPGWTAVPPARFELS